MDRSPFINAMMAMLAATSLGCAGPALFHGTRAENSSDDSVEQATATADAPQEQAERLADRSQARLSDINATESTASAEDAELIQFLEALRERNPEKHAQLTAILSEHESGAIQPFERYIRDQYLAMMIQDNQQPASTAKDAGTESPVGNANSSDIQLVSAATTPAGESVAPATVTTAPSSLPPAAANPPITPPLAVAATAPSAATTPDASVANPLASEDAAPPTTGLSQQEPESAEEEVKPGTWYRQLLTTRDVLEKESARTDLDEGERTRLRTYLRLLNVLANRREQAVAPIDGLSEDEQEFWKHLNYGLLISLDADAMHASSRRAALALRDLRTATEHLASISTLDVRGLAFCNRVESYGRFTEFKSYTFAAGDEVLLYVEVDNFAVEVKGEEFETELQGEYDIFDEQGVRVANVVLPRDKQLCRNRRRDYFIAYRLYLPDDIRPGAYTLRLTIEDVKGKKSNQASIDFRIR
jgi:hypothetical protein